MIGSVVVLCIVGFVLWLALNIGTGLAASKLEFLEPDAPDGEPGGRRGRRKRSSLRVRYGPLSLRAKHVLLAEKSLKIVSGFLIGLYPVDVTKVQVDEYNVHFGWGLTRFVKAWWRGEERERLAPKLVVRLVGVRVALKGNGIEDWEKQTEAMAAGIEGMNHNQANLLTALLDKTAPAEGEPPSKIYKLVDAIVNALDVEVERLHFSLASANHQDTRQEETQPQQQQQQSSEQARNNSSGSSRPAKDIDGAGWVLGVKFDHFRLSKKADPSEETLGITPRSLKLECFNMYYDIDGTPVRRTSTSTSSLAGNPRDQREGVVGVGGPPPLPQPGSTTVVRGGDDPEIYPEDGTSSSALPLRPLTSDALAGSGGSGGIDETSAGLRRPDDHNSLLMVESIGGTFLFPDLMCGLLGVGRQPGGHGKLMAVDFDEVSGVVVELEPFQVFGLLNDAVPLLSLMGPYTEWCDNARLQWHKEAFARRVPSTPGELEKYAEALGSAPGDGSGGGGGESKKCKGNAAELRKLDKGMSLPQTMLTRMRVRGWDVTRPERVMNWANLLLNSMDPFQGVLVEDLAGAGVPGGGGGEGAGGEGDDQESDEESPSVSSGQSEAMPLSLQTRDPEEDARLESLLYYAAQESAHAAAEGPVLMEIDIRMSARDVTLLVYHPPVDKNYPGKAADAGTGEVGAGQDDGGSVSSAGGDDSEDLPDMEELARQNSTGSVRLAECELATGEATLLRDGLQLPALAASVVIDDFKFGFNLMMGSVACAAGGGEKGKEEEQEEAPAAINIEGGCSEDPGAAAAAGADDPEEEGMPVQLHTFSNTMLVDARPIRLYKPSRLGQGADLRVEDFGDADKVSDGVAGMSLSMVLGGTRVTDFGALENGGVLPTLIGGPAAAAAAAATATGATGSGSGGGGGDDDSHAAGGTTKLTLALFTGGRLELGLDFDSFTVVALPGRIMSILDVVLACLMGPPAARKAQELNALEDEVEMEEVEEATGAVGANTIVDSRWKAIDKVRGAYLFLGRLDARFSVRVNDFSLLLPQDSRDTRTNVIMAQSSALALDMKSGSAFETLALDVCDFSVAPCVQHRETPEVAVESCCRLHEAGIAVALRGPLPELLGVIHRGFPLKDLDLFPIPERRIVLPVNMKVNYSTFVTLRAEETKEASADSLVPEMMKFNSGADLAAMRVADQQEHQQLAAVAALTGEEDAQGSDAASTLSMGPKKTKTTQEGATARGGGGGKKAETLSGLFVLMEVQLHVSSGLHMKVTDLDIAVLQGIANSLVASLGSGGQAAGEGGGAAGRAGGAKTGQQSSAAGKSLTYALDSAQRRMVASLRQAFRLADANGDGTLDRAEVEALLRHNLHGQNLDPAQTEAEVLQFIALLDADGTDTLDIDEFTSTMMRLMTDGPDEVTLERARRQALTKAFEEADADYSGSLDAGEIMELLKNSDPLRTHSELDRQVSRYIHQVDANGDNQLDLEEFMELVHSMRAGNVHEGPLEPTAEEFRSWEIIRPILEGFKTLPELLAARPADFSPPGFWELFESETHATQSGSCGQLTEAVQAKMVKTFDNYGFARDAWSFLVAPAWYHGVVRVGSLSAAGADAGGGGGDGDGGNRARSLGPQQMSAPVRPGAFVYAQEQHREKRRTSSAASFLAGMKIQRLPEELAAPPTKPPVVDPLLLSTPPQTEKFVTGVRLPPPPAGRRHSLRGATASPGVTMEIDRPCTLLVCFHDDAASTGAQDGDSSDKDAGPALAELAYQASSSSVGGSQLNLPKWATRMGLCRTNMHIETVLPGEGDAASASHHVYRVFSTPIAAGTVTLGSSLPGSLPYFVLLYGGNNLQRHTSRGRRHPSVQRPLRAATDSGQRQRRRQFGSIFRKAARAPALESSALGGSGGSGGSSINSLSSKSRGSSAGVVVSSAMQRGVSGESIELTPAAAAPAPAAPRAPERHASVASATSSIGAVAAAAVNANPSWQLTPRYSLGGATRGVTSIATKADKHAKKAAGTAMKIAAISSAGTAAASAASGGAGVEVAKQPRVRLKVTLLCEHGIFVQMDDIHRLENTPTDDDVSPTFELALMVPPQGGGGGGSGDDSKPRSPGSLPPSMEQALRATLDFEHVASAEILGAQDSMDMKAAFGVEGRYFNPRVQQSEHFIEPWSMAIEMSDPRGDSTPSGQMTADRHFVLNATTGLTSLACSIMESRDYAKTRYSTTSVYTELRDGARDGDDGSRLLSIENHLGVPVSVTLEEDEEEDDLDLSGAGSASMHGRARSFRPKKAGAGSSRHRRGTSSSSHQARIAPSLYHQRLNEGEEVGGDGPPADRISVGELTVPDAKKSLPTATVTVAAKGFLPVTGIPLDLLGRGTHVYRMTRLDGRREDKPTKKWLYEGMVVKFVARAARHASVLDLAMQLQTNVSLRNDLPRPLRVSLSYKNEKEPNTVVPVNAEVCLPFPVLQGRILQFWKSPRILVGGEALKKALKVEAEREARDKRGSTGGSLGMSVRGASRFGPGGWDGAAAEAAEDVNIGDEVSVDIPPTTFDRTKRVVERHSQNMLTNGVSVERSDLAPTPGLVMHGSGDEPPALWRLYVRAPYVIQNGLACDIVVWASQPQPEPEPDASGADAGLASPGSATAGVGKRRLRLKSFGRSHKKDADGSTYPASAKSGSGSRFKFTPRPWNKSSSAPLRGGAGFAATAAAGSDALEGNVDSDSDDDTDGLDDDDSETDDSVDEEEEEEEEHVDTDDDEEEENSAESDRRSPATGASSAVVAARAEHGRRSSSADGRVMWVLKSGEEAKLEGMDMTLNLRLRVGFAPADGGSSCSDFCKPFVIEAKRHTSRTLLNRLESKEAVFTKGARGSGGARRPEFKFGAVWEHTPGNKHIHIYCKVWVVNKTGVALAYRASIPTKNDEHKDAVFVRRPHNATYRTDGDTMLFSSYMTGGRRCSSLGGGSLRGAGDSGGGRAGFPLMLTCHASKLQTMPYAMADSAIDPPLLLSETRSSKAEQPLPCLAVSAEDTDGSGGGDGGDGVTGASWPLYCDYPPARVRLATEVAPEGRRRVHLLTMRADTGSVTFTPSRDCRVYVGLDKRVIAAGAPKWLALRGFERCPTADVARNDVTPADLAPQGFGLYSRFCRGLSIVPLGKNVDHDGDSVEEKHGGGSAAMYFVVVVRVPEVEAVAEVDIGPVAMHRSVGKILEFREHHRWRVKPNFKPGDPCYNDKPASDYTVTALPDKLRGLKLFQIVTAQGDKRVKANNLASFQLLQKSRVLVCFDSRASKHPSWLAKRGFRFQAEMDLPTDPAGTGENGGYMIFAKIFPEGAEVKLGGNKASGAKRMYFVLVHTIGSQEGRISAPPRLEKPPFTPPSPASTELVAAASAGGLDADPFGEGSVGGGGGGGGGGGSGGRGRDELRRSGKRKGGVVESKDDQVFRFWDDEASGKLVQAPLDLDRQGRGWCEPFATDAVKTSGQAKSPAGVFGVTIEALSGAFLKTRVVTVWPRFVVRNNLGRKVGILSTVEPPPKRGKDHSQSIAKATEEEMKGLRNVQRCARKATQAVPDGASVVIYDFADPDDYDYDEGEDARDATAGFGSGGGSSTAKPNRRQLQAWKRTKRGKEEKLPCVRLLSGVHKDGANRKGSGSGSVGAGVRGSGDDVQDGDAAATGEEWVQLPTVPVLLENMGKDTYVWMEGGREQEDVLVRVSCRMLSNGATIHVVLSNETPSPPLRIENRSSTQTLCYRLGGEADENVRLLEPMRWNSLHWVSDDKRLIEAAVYTGNDLIRKRRHKLKKALVRSKRAAVGLVDDDSDDDSDDGNGNGNGDDDDDDLQQRASQEQRRMGFSSFRWGSKGIFGDSPRRDYKTDDVGRLKDLVGGKRKVGGEVRLKVECLRPLDSVVTTVLAFSDTPDGVYGKASHDAAALSRESTGEAASADDDKDPEDDEGEVESKFARIWTDLHFEANFAGLVLNIIDSTPSGPSEMAAFTVDGFELGKPSGTPGVTLSVWHFQLDDMRADSPHPIILAPQSSGFNSHLTKVHYNNMRGAPAFRVELERDVQVSMTHHMSVIRSIEVSLGKVHCAVHVDFWIDVQDVVFASLNWTNSSPEEARARAIAGAQGVVGKPLHAPAADATVDRIYIGEYLQEEMEVAVDFHLGKKVAALLSSKPAADGDEEKDEGGFGASVAMMPLGAVGGVVWGLLSSFGAGIANASPTFKFDPYYQEHYYGSKTQAVRLVVMSFVKQGVVQAYKVLGHIDILGDPLSLGMSISSGVIGFVTKTGAGHIGEGSKDLVKGVVGGAASSASKMTDALDNFVRGAGGMDAETPSGMETAKAPEHLGQGLTQGMMYFGHTVKDGITGVMMKPVRGAKEGGALGFVKGVGQGVVGLVAAPVSATLGATSKITASIDATTRLLDDPPMGRRREPRHPLGGGEREDRDRLKKQLQKARERRHRRLQSSSGGGSSKSGDGVGFEELEDIPSDENDDGSDGDQETASVDTRAEAGGMGLLLVPLTPTDMRTNYPKEYLERCQTDMASKAGAVAIAKAVEEDLKNLAKLVAAANKGGSIAEEEKSAVAAVADGAAGNTGTEESKGAEGDAGQQPSDATTAATGETSAAPNQAPAAGESV